MWSTNPPKKSGWYIVTLQDGIVMPLYRMEYPKGNFSWNGLACGSEVIACIKFPKPYSPQTKGE